LEQTSAPVHAVVQSPQCASSLFRSTQAPEHTFRPVPQPSAQTPALQTWFAEQGVPQAPQCAGSLARSTHAPEQVVFPASQTQSPALQISAAPHAVVQSPQWLALPLVSMHPPEHSTSGLVQLAVHWPS
jgi:hypothetical protein